MRIVTRLAFGQDPGTAIVLGMDNHSGLGEFRRNPPLSSAIFVGDRTCFGGPSDPDKRLVVLTPDEYELAEKKFGAFYPGEGTRFFMNQNGTKAFWEWTEHWRGGSFVVEKVGNEWQIHSLGEWIT